MSETFNFDDMRPYYDSEAHEVLQRMTKDPLFAKLTNYIWPERTLEESIAIAKKVDSILGFQVLFMHPAILTIVSRTSTGLTYSGFENLNKSESYLFIANHRDILLDSAILQILLVENDFNTSEITFGNNLMETQFITDFGKINRMFTVLREGTSRELYDISKKLSAYIRHTLVEKKLSVWIAQRSGRTKDGNDITQTGLLKMLNISGNGDFSESFRQLKIVPLTISYEYEPCDALKVQEIYLSSMHTQYKKAPGEDINNIITGIVQPKGGIHLAFGKPIMSELLEFDKYPNDNEKIKQLTDLVDRQIYNNYKLWPVNYIACDIIENSTRYNTKYTPGEKDDFMNYTHTKIAKMNGEPDVLYNLFIKMYANPVKNKTAPDQN